MFACYSQISAMTLVNTSLTFICTGKLVSVSQHVFAETSVCFAPYRRQDEGDGR